MTPMTTQDLARLAREATPGPWEASDTCGGDRWVLKPHGLNFIGICRCYKSPQTGVAKATVNSEYIAAANPQAILSLIEENERLRAERDVAEDENKHISADKYEHAWNAGWRAACICIDAIEATPNCDAIKALAERHERVEAVTLSAAKANIQARQEAEAESVRLSDRVKALEEALAGMVGLMQLLDASSEISASVKDVMNSNHRVVTARSVLGGQHGG